jgi:hypothetical protein
VIQTWRLLSSTCLLCNCRTFHWGAPVPYLTEYRIACVSFSYLPILWKIQNRLA